MNTNTLSIVPLDKIPTEQEIVDCPLDNLAELYGVCLRLQELCGKEGGVGISAVQAGIPWRLFLIRDFAPPNRTYFRYFLNCKYIPLDEAKMQSMEGCLSIRNPGGGSRMFMVERFQKIKVEGFEFKTEPNLEVVPVDFEPAPFQSIVYQHEIDHAPLTGKPILISDIGIEYDVWKNKRA